MNKEKIIEEWKDYIVKQSEQGMMSPLFVMENVANWWLNQIDLAIQEERERIEREMIAWTNSNYRRSTQPLYAWIDAQDLVDKIKKLI